MNEVQLALAHRQRHLAASRLQAAFRQLLSRRAAAQARRLLVDQSLLWRLATLCARVEQRSAARIQWRWRALRQSREFHTRIALTRIGRGVHRHKAQRAARALRERAMSTAKCRVRSSLHLSLIHI